MSTAPENKDPLHGVTLEAILVHLVEHLGWGKMAEEVRIRCFEFEPSVQSSLKFLRKTPWARTKVEQLYVHHVRWLARQGGPRA